MRNVELYEGENIGKDSGLCATVKKLSTTHGELMVECAFSLSDNFDDLSFEDVMGVLKDLMIHSCDISSPARDELFATDPTVKERNRIYSCKEKDFFLENIRRQYKKFCNTKDISFDEVYIPCRIRYNFWGICSSSEKVNVPLQRLHNIGPLILDRYSLPSPNWIAIARDDNLTALVASTIWFSIESGKEIWSICDNSEHGISLNNCQQDTNYCRGESLLKCYVYQSKRCWNNFKKLLTHGSFCEAYKSLCMTILLSSNRYLMAPVIRMLKSLPFCIKSVLDTMDMLRDVLIRSDVLSMNIEVIGRSIRQNISIKLRYIFSSPSMIHLRGGSILLLRTLENFELSLQLEPYVHNGSDTNILFRQALGMPDRIPNSLNLLKCLHSMCRLFKYTLEKDLHNNCSFELKEVIEKFPAMGFQVTTHCNRSSSNFVTLAHKMNLLLSTKKLLCEEAEHTLGIRRMVVV